LTPIDSALVNYKGQTGEYEVRDMLRSLPSGTYYWKLPREFIGDKVSDNLSPSLIG